MSQSGSWVAKEVDQGAREAAREAARSEGLTLGEYLDRLMKTSSSPKPNEISGSPESRRPRSDSASDALEKLTRRIEAAEARSALAITSMDNTIHDLVGRLEDSQQTTVAIAAHVDGMIDQLRETHDALKQKVRRLEEDESQQDNLEALKALESALGKLANHVYEESSLAQQEALAIKGRVESGFMDIIERVEAMEIRVETTQSDTAKQIKDGVDQAALRTAGVARQVSERMDSLETEVQERLDARSGDQERLDATETRLEAVESDVSGALETMDTRFDRIQDRLTRAETTTEAAMKSLESSVSSLDERIGEVASKMDPDLADRLRSEFEARFEDMMSSVRQTVDTVRQELAEEINRAASGQEDAVAEFKETLGSLQERLDANEEHQADTVEKVSGQITVLSETFDTRLREVEERSDAAAGDAVREEIERLGKTVTDRIDELAEDLSKRVNDSEARSAEAIEQIGDQVAAATNRLQMRQNESIKTLAEQVDENRKKADARLNDTLASVSERLEQMQSQANESLSPVQKAIGMLAARLESLEDITPPPGRASEAEIASELAKAESDFTHLGDDPTADIPFEEFETLGGFDSFEELDDFSEFGDYTAVENADASSDPSLAVPEIAPEADFEDEAVAFESEDEHVEASEEDDEAAEFEAGIGSWDDAEDDAVIDETAEGFEDDFDAIRAAVEGLSFATQDSDPLADLIEPDEDEAVEAEAFEDALDPLVAEIDPLDDLDEAHTEARESDIFDDEEFETLDLPLVDEVPRAAPDIEEHAETKAPEGKQLDPDTADYLTRARKAAMAASFGRGATTNARAANRPVVQFTSAGGSGRLPLIAAASAVAIAGVAAGGYLFLRGKQEAPVQPSPASTYVDPGVTEADAAALAAEENTDTASDPSTAGMDQELFGDAPAMPARYAPVPPVVTVEAAAAAGNSIAQYQLAQDKLTRGEYADGAALIRRAAQKGLPMAQYALAKLHERGTGVPKDLALAREWTEKAAHGGNVKAMHDLAVFMAEGEGGEQTYAGAVEWFRKGAEYGVVDSQYNLGVLYEQGLGISPNLTESLFWFDVANRNGDGGAPSKISELIERVSPEAAAQARSRAASWTAAPSNGIANGRFGAQIWNMGNPLQVQAIQNALNALGYDAGTPDGIMGTSTTQAVKDYQSANNLPVTGTVTEQLIDALNAGATPEY